MKIQLRSPAASEIGHVLDSWARSFAHFNPAVPPRGLSNYVWYQAHRAWIRDFLAKDTVRVLVAVHPEQDDTIMGWICWEAPGKHPLTLHYVHVKQFVRRRGVATTLVTAALATRDSRGYRESHHTANGGALMQSVDMPSDGRAQREGPPCTR